MGRPESGLLHSVEMLHWCALAFMGAVYSYRLIWMLRFKPGKDRQAPGERRGDTSAYPGLYSLANVAMPWFMESTRKDFAFWLNFVVFHLCAFSGIFFAIISSAYRPFVEVRPVGVYFTHK